MDRELLLEIGCEELPASWLPGLTNQIGEAVIAQLRAQRLAPETPAETFSTPRRLTVRIARIPERQTDLEELVNGPPVSAGFKPDGTPTPAASGFASKQGVEVSALERIQTPKGEYLAYRKRQRGKTSVDVLPDVLGGDAARHWRSRKRCAGMRCSRTAAASCCSGVRSAGFCILYGGRVVPFTISRTSAAQTSQVQDVDDRRSHLRPSVSSRPAAGRAGRSRCAASTTTGRGCSKISSCSSAANGTTRSRARSTRRRSGCRAGSAEPCTATRACCTRCPTLSSTPAVVAGTFAHEFLELPDEVLTTTLIHHQHYFPVEGEDGALKNAFLAVINIEPDNERTIARNAERVVTARLRDARFFWEADRKTPLEARIERLGTLVFHKKLGTYKEKAERIERLARWIAKEAFGATDEVASQAAEAARLAKADLTTDMVREFTELQGTMGGVYARKEGKPEAVWKAIYFHYLPHGVEADAPPTRAELGAAAVTWAAVSLADKLDTIVGLFAAGEKPTGSRDPYGLRRAAQGVVKILTDLPDLGVNRPVDLPLLIQQAYQGHVAEGGARDGWRALPLGEFFAEREAHLFERRGYRSDESRAVAAHWGVPAPRAQAN